MSEEPKAIGKIALLLLAGLGPGLVAILIWPSRGIAISAAGSFTPGCALYPPSGIAPASSRRINSEFDALPAWITFASFNVDTSRTSKL